MYAIYTLLACIHYIHLYIVWSQLRSVDAQMHGSMGPGVALFLEIVAIMIVNKS